MHFQNSVETLAKCSYNICFVRWGSAGRLGLGWRECLRWYWRLCLLISDSGAQLDLRSTFQKEFILISQENVSHLPSCNFVQHENTRFFMNNKNKHESAQLARAVIRKHMNTNLYTKTSNNFTFSSDCWKNSVYFLFSFTEKQIWFFFSYGDSVIKMS